MKSLISRLRDMTATELGVVLVLVGFLLIALSISVSTARADEGFFKTTGPGTTSVIYPEELQVRVEKLEEAIRMFAGYIEYVEMVLQFLEAREAAFTELFKMQINLNEELEARIKALEERGKIDWGFDPGFRQKSSMKVGERYFDGCNWNTYIGNGIFQSTLLACGD